MHIHFPLCAADVIELKSELTTVVVRYGEEVRMADVSAICAIRMNVQRSTVIDAEQSSVSGQSVKHDSMRGLPSSVMSLNVTLISVRVLEQMLTME